MLHTQLATQLPERYEKQRKRNERHCPSAPTPVGASTPGGFAASTTESEHVAAVAQGGSKLVVTDSNGPTQVYVLDTNPQQAADQLCSITASPITAAQWAQDAPGVTYQNPCPRWSQYPALMCPPQASRGGCRATTSASSTANTSNSTSDP